MALNSVKSQLVWGCIQQLDELGKTNKVTLMWVPGHSGIHGNETADLLAREGGSKTFTGPEPFCGLPRSHCMQEISKWETRTKISHWTQAPGLKQSKNLISYSKNWTKKILLLSKTDARVLAGTLTGHCPVKYHLRNVGKVDNNTCSFSKETHETAEHLLCHFNTGLLEPKEVHKTSTRKVVKFMRELLPEWE